MHSRTRSLIAAVAATGLVLAGCSTQESGSPAAPSSPAPGASVDATVPSGPAGSIDAEPTDTAGGEPADTAGGEPTDTAGGEPADTAGGEPTDGGSAVGAPADPAEFAGRLEAGMKSVTSLTAKLDAGSGGAGGAGTVAQRLENGALVAADMSIAAGGQEMNIRIVDGQVFLGGPMISGVAPEAAGKEWILIDAGSSNQQIAMLANTLGTIISNAGTDSYVFMARAITDLSAQGSETIGSFETTKYQAVIDVQKMAEVLPDSMKEYGSLLQASGLQEMEVWYWIDGEGRMVQSETTVEVAGQTQTNKLTVESFNEPVDIPVPDPSTVYSG